MVSPSLNLMVAHPDDELPRRLSEANRAALPPAVTLCDVAADMAVRSDALRLAAAWPSAAIGAGACVGNGAGAAVVDKGDVRRLVLAVGCRVMSPAVLTSADLEWLDDRLAGTGESNPPDDRRWRSISAWYGVRGRDVGCAWLVLLQWQPIVRVCVRAVVRASIQSTTTWHHNVAHSRHRAAPRVAHDRIHRRCVVAQSLFAGTRDFNRNRHENRLSWRACCRWCVASSTSHAC